MLSATWGPYISLPHREGGLSAQEQTKEDREFSGDVGENQDISADRQGAVHERAAAVLFPPEAAQLAGGHPPGGQGYLAASAGREPEPPRYRRPGVIGNRPRHRACLLYTSPSPRDGLLS